MSGTQTTGNRFLHNHSVKKKDVLHMGTLVGQYEILANPLKI